MFKRERNVVLPVAIARRSRIIGEHRWTALSEYNLRADRKQRR